MSACMCVFVCTVTLSMNHTSPPPPLPPLSTPSPPPTPPLPDSTVPPQPDVMHNLPWWCR